MGRRHGPGSTCPGYLEGRFIDGSPGRYSCPWCAMVSAAVHATANDLREAHE